MKITLTNDFHNTTVTLNAKEATCNGSKILVLSKSQVSKAKKTLCGCSDCQCSNDLGNRGNQDYSNIEVSQIGEATMYSKLN